MKLKWIFLVAPPLLGCADGQVPASEHNESVEVASPNDSNAAAKPSVTQKLPAEPVSACLTQDGRDLEIAAVKAVGTEPFWAVETDGRCLTYRTPEDQQGTRIWTRVEAGPRGSFWDGALRGRQFRLDVRPAPGCSDGMSDKTYPLEAVLRVDGETRRGCAEPL